MCGQLVLRTRMAFAGVRQQVVRNGCKAGADMTGCAGPGLATTRARAHVHACTCTPTGHRRVKIKITVVRRGSMDGDGNLNLRSLFAPFYEHGVDCKARLCSTGNANSQETCTSYLDTYLDIHTIHVQLHAAQTPPLHTHTVRSSITRTAKTCRLLPTCRCSSDRPDKKTHLGI